MRWETPSFVEIKMDAEIGGYQDDFGDPPDVAPFQDALIPLDPKVTDPEAIRGT
ncbi:hypothetical protein [Nitrospira sp. Nam74]